MSDELQRRPALPLEGKVAIVTGAAQGLGRCFARRLHDDGARVVIADVNGEKGQAAAEEIGYGRDTCLAIETDVSDETSAANVVAATVEAFGRLDILVNNAAVFSTIAMSPFTEISTRDWDRMMAVNVRGTFLLSRSAVPEMQRQQYGKIVNISSATVWIGRPNYLHYVTSKSALIGFTRALAREVGPSGIRVNAVTPGATLTEVPRATVTTGEAARIVAAQSIQRRETPTDVEGVVAFLCGPDSDFISGQTINVDGGAAFH